MDQIGRYEILDELGRGAMGVVYLARDTKIGREVAIKTIKFADQDSLEAGKLRERLFREAQSAGRLSHPGIVTIYDVAEEGELAYITMEFVDGETLQTMMEEGRVKDSAFISSILGQAAAALDYAHSREIVHRDVKPANIMVTADGTVKITDFGIARISSSTLTQTGTVMGTPSYMSPEQVRGDPIDGASDQFSLSVITYEMLTEQKPFSGDSLTAVMFKIVSGEVLPPSKLVPSIPQEIENTILRGLAKSNGDRFSCCKDFAESVSRGWGSDPAILPPSAIAPTAAQDYGSGEAPTVVQTPAPTEDSAADQDQLETVVHPLTADNAPTEVMTGLPPLGETGADAPSDAAAEEAASADQPPSLPVPESVPFATAEEPPKRGPWLAIAAVAGLVVAGSAYWVLQNPGMLGGGASEVVGTAEPGDPAAEETTAAPIGQPAMPETPSSGPATGGTQETTPASKPPEPTRIAAAPPPKVEPAPTPPPSKPKAPPAPARAAKAVEVTFSTKQAGARVIVDGKPQWSCNLPCSLELPRGEYTASVSMTGFYRIRKPFKVGSDPIDLAFEMEEVVGTVLVSSSPSGADIYVDGKKFDGQTNTSVRLRPGYHLIKIEKAGTGMVESSVLVREGQLSSQQFSLATQPPRAQLNITTTPAGAQIVLNDRRRSGATPRELDLPPGDYRVMLSLPGHRPVIKEIKLPPNQAVAMDEKLTPR